MIEGSWFNVSLLKQLEFCPVLPWILARTGYKEPETVSQRAGREVDLNKVVQRLDLKGEVLKEVFLRDQRSGLSGIVDLIVRGERVTVVEVKAFKRGSFGHFRLQLLSYAYLAYRTLGRADRAVLWIGDEVGLDIEVREEHLRAVEERLRRLRRVLEREEPPPVERECGFCQYRRVCPRSSP